MTAYIKVKDASLKVPIYLQPDRQARGWGSVFLGAIFDPPRRRYATLLEDLDFEVKAGDRLAILGRNGAGKSTLLRLLNGVYAPTSGTVEVSGNRSAMLNIQLGFNAHATVRENIFLRGAAMGLSPGFLREQVVPILEFAGLVEKANHRLHTLSAGQNMRLGFAISTSVQRDVILMDEWIGTGDANFKQRVKDRMSEQLKGDTIIVLASHSSGLVRTMCNKAIVLERGRLIHAGDIEPSLKFYHEHLARLREQTAVGIGTDDLPAGQLIYGCVENIHLEAGVLHLKGWLACVDGPLPQHLMIATAGARFPARRIERYNRPDVVQHLGLAEDRSGFNAVFKLPGLKSLRDLQSDLEVFGGMDRESTHSPLRLGPAVLDAIEHG